jgi:hypothetical protein
MDAESAPGAPKRRIIFWTVVVVVGAILLALVGTLVFSFVNAEELVEDAGGGLAAYLTVSGSSSPTRSCRSSRVRRR